MKKRSKVIQTDYKLFLQEYIKNNSKDYDQKKWKTDPIGSRMDFNSLLIESKWSYLKMMIEYELSDIEYDNKFRFTYHLEKPICKIEYFNNHNKEDKFLLIITIYFKKSRLPEIDQTEFNYIWDNNEKGYKFYFHPDDNIEYLYEIIRDLYRELGGEEDFFKLIKS